MKLVHSVMLFLCMVAISIDMYGMFLCARKSPQLRARFGKSAGQLRFYKDGHSGTSENLQIKVNELQMRLDKLEKSQITLFENYEALSLLVYLNNHDTYIAKYDMHYDYHKRNNSDE